MKSEFGNLEQIKMLQTEKRRRYENPLEEYIDIEADLGWQYFSLSEIYKQLGGESKLSPIELLIEKATGNNGDAELLITVKLVLRQLYEIKRLKNKLNNKFGRNYTLDDDLATIVAVKKLIKSLNH